MEIGDQRTGDEATIAVLVNMRSTAPSTRTGGRWDIVTRLRREGALSISLDAEDTWTIVGHVALSPVEMTSPRDGSDRARLGSPPPTNRAAMGQPSLPRNWHGSAPAAPAAAGCLESRAITTFGFAEDPRPTDPGAPAPFFPCLSFRGPVPAGEVRYLPEFGA